MPTKKIAVSQDTTISELFKDKNYGTFPLTHGGWFYSSTIGAYRAESYWKFSYTDSVKGWGQIPPGARILKATLWLSAYSIEDRASSPTYLNLYRLASNWDYSSTTWNSGWATEGILQFSNFASRPGNWTAIDVSSYAFAAYSNPTLRNYGLKARAPSPDSPYSGTYWQSSNSDNSGSHPHMDVTYDAAALPAASFDSSKDYIRWVGSGVNHAKLVYVFKSATSTGTFSFYDVANSDLSNFTWTDLAKAPPPTTPNTTTEKSGAQDVKVSWTGAGQPSYTAYYKFRRVLNDDTPSVLTGAHQGTKTPSITKYQVHRSVDGGAWTLVYEVGPSAREYIDKTLVAGSNVSYRVYAFNSQGSVSSYTTSSISIARPTPPNFSSLSVSNNLFVLQGTLAPTTTTPRSINVYQSIDGSNYALAASLNSPTTDTWAVNVKPSTTPPPAPTVTISSLIEKTITLDWNRPANAGSTRWFKVSRVIEGVESDQTVSNFATLTPVINKYIVERKLATQDDVYYTTVYNGNADAFTDTNVEFGTVYTYRITAYNNFGQASSPVLRELGTSLPGPPTINSPIKKTTTDKKHYIRLSGAGVNTAPQIQIQRSVSPGVWSNLKLGKYGIPPEGIGTEQWWEDDTALSVSAPNAPVWQTVQRPVDTDGIHLKWSVSTNTNKSFSYRAIRKFDTVLGTPTDAKSIIIQPIVTKYAVQRRETPVAGQPLTAVNDWILLRTLTGTPPLTNLDDFTVEFNKSYDYRVFASNDFDLAGSPSLIKTLSTFNAPPPPPAPPPPISPVVGNGRPVGVVNVFSGGLLRINWDYSHPNNEPQIAYKLSVIYTKNNVINTRHWSGSSWLSDPNTIVQSGEQYADLDANLFESGITYRFTLSVQSSNGGWS